jgi:hypothetical protein
MRHSIIVVLLALGGCRTAAIPITTPAMEPITANQSCNLPPDEWHQIEAPPSRDQLLNLPTPRTQRPVMTFFAARNDRGEAWFEDSNRNLQACIYNPKSPMSCHGGELQLVRFTREGDLWKAEEIRLVTCSD